MRPRRTGPKPLCAYCKAQRTKEHKNKFCSRACALSSKTFIDRDKVVELRGRGLSYIQIARHVPATADSIRKAMSRHRSAA